MNHHALWTRLVRQDVLFILDGKRFRAERKKRKLRQNWVARMAGVSTSYLNEIEHGRRLFPNNGIVSSLVKVLEEYDRVNSGLV